MSIVTANKSEPSTSTTHDELRTLVSHIIHETPSTELFDAREFLEMHPELAEHQSLTFDLAYEEFARRNESGESVDPKEFAQRFPELGEDIPELCGFLNMLVGQISDTKDEEICWPKLGTKIDNFHLMSEIGRGAFSRVYLARDLGYDSMWRILKVCQFAQDEVGTQARLKHKNIVEIVYVAEFRKNLSAICMKYESQVTMADLLTEFSDRNSRLVGHNFVQNFVSTRNLTVKSLMATKAVGDQSTIAIEYDSSAQERGDKESIESPTPTLSESGEPDTQQNLVLNREKLVGKRVAKNYWKSILRIALDVANGMNHAHSESVRHGDIKPSNILLLKNGTAKLFDFNLSNDLNQDSIRLGGTLPFMAPEITKTIGKKGVKPDINESTDIYSFGATFYQALSCELPFGMPEGDNESPAFAAKLINNYQKPPKRLIDYYPSMNPEFADLIHECLSISADGRPANAAEIVTRLEAIHENVFTKPQKQKLQIKWIAIGTALLFSLVLVALMSFNSFGPQQENGSFEFDEQIRMGDEHFEEYDFFGAVTSYQRAKSSTTENELIQEANIRLLVAGSSGYLEDDFDIIAETMENGAENPDVALDQKLVENFLLSRAIFERLTAPQVNLDELELRYSDIPEEYRDWTFWNNWAHIKLKLQDLDSAESLFKKALDLCPDKYSEMQVRYGEAFGIHAKVASRNPTYDNLTKTISCFDELLRESPSDTWVRMDRIHFTLSFYVVVRSDILRFGEVIDGSISDRKARVLSAKMNQQHMVDLLAALENESFIDFDQHGLNEYLHGYVRSNRELNLVKEKILDDYRFLNDQGIWDISAFGKNYSHLMEFPEENYDPQLENSPQVIEAKKSVRTYVRFAPPSTHLFPPNLLKIKTVETHELYGFLGRTLQQ